MTMNRLLRGLGLLAAVLTVAALVVPGAVAQDESNPTFGRPHIDAVAGRARGLNAAEVTTFGRTVFKGKIDINPTRDRTRAGKDLDHRNDGAFFENREGKLPRHKDR